MKNLKATRSNNFMMIDNDGVDYVIQSTSFLYL